MIKYCYFCIDENLIKKFVVGKKILFKLFIKVCLLYLMFFFLFKFLGFIVFLGKILKYIEILVCFFIIFIILINELKILLYIYCKICKLVICNVKLWEYFFVLKSVFVFFII